MTTPTPRPRRPPLLARADQQAGPCQACKRLKWVDSEGWEICAYCDTSPHDPNPAHIETEGPPR